MEGDDSSGGGRLNCLCCMWLYTIFVSLKPKLTLSLNFTNVFLFFFMLYFIYLLILIYYSCLSIVFWQNYFFIMKLIFVYCVFELPHLP